MARATVKKVTKPLQDPRLPPPPFLKAPAALEPFVESLDGNHVYIVHVDRFPAGFKKRIFTVPVLLNVTIAALLVWRVYAILPTYLAIFTSVIGLDSSATIDTASKTKSHLAWVLTKRVAMFMFDFVLGRFILPWPVTFFLEAPANPCYWRIKVGFRDQEVAVRISRDWGTEELLAGVKTGGDSPFFTTRILPAIERNFMRQKTAYLMMGKDWDLDFGAMVFAHRLIDDKKNSLQDFEKSVLAYSEHHGWLYWPVHKLDEEGSEEENRKKIVALKDRLTVMGKESLFFRWIEIVQYESSRPGGFTQERQVETYKKVQEEFEKHGVDFRELLEKVGGLDGMPGLPGSQVPL
jgi:hypothetical protein